MMTGLLMMFYLLFTQISRSRTACNSGGDDIRLSDESRRISGSRGEAESSPNPDEPLRRDLTLSFTLTTIGYLGAAWSVARAAVLAM